MSPTPPLTLTIAGSDPTAGAGIEADLKTFAALGVYGTSVITALTAQDTLGVRALHPTPPDFLRLQLATLLDDLPPAAVKLGMLANSACVSAVADELTARHLPNLVLDPVLRSSDGTALLDPDGERELRARLLPLADVLTPNLPEAAHLLGWELARVRSDRESACRELARLGPRAIVLKGGHAESLDAEDLLFAEATFTPFTARRIATRNTHGTGCAFSSAIAAGLARGLALREAVGLAKTFVTLALQGSAAWRIGSGRGPLHHLHGGGVHGPGPRS
jgi:hydroxymethylpyrimidine/phosphomethylpyrimidine kinase